MWRKLTAGLFILMIIFIIPMGGIADDIEVSKYQVTIPEEDISFSKNNIALILGKAPEGTDVKIEVYGAIDLNKEKYSLNKLPQEEDYTLISTLELKSGALGFAEEVELISGINKIIVHFNVEDVPSIEKIIYYHNPQTITNNFRNTSVFPTTN